MQLASRVAPLSHDPHSFKRTSFQQLTNFLKQTAATLATHSLTLRLHNLADLHGRIEELGGTAVQADGLALVELALAVVGGHALLLA